MKAEMKNFVVPADGLKVHTDERIIEGYASVFDFRDFGGDVITEGAYSKSIQERFPKGRVKVLREHHQPIGMPVELREDTRGLFTRSRISETPLGDETLILANDGVLDGMSVGISIMKQEFGKHDGKSTRFIKEAMLHEFSLVPFPMNDESRVTAVKSFDQAMQLLADLPELLEFLDDEQITDEQKAAAALIVSDLEQISRKFRGEQTSNLLDELRKMGAPTGDLITFDDDWGTTTDISNPWSDTIQWSDNTLEQIKENKGLFELIDLSFRLPSAIEQVLRPESLQEQAQLHLGLAADEYEKAASTIRALLEPDETTQTEPEPVDATPTEEPLDPTLTAVGELIGEIVDFARSKRETANE